MSGKARNRGAGHLFRGGNIQFVQFIFIMKGMAVFIGSCFRRSARILRYPFQVRPADAGGAENGDCGGSSGGPAVPTVQRGIVKMVRAGPGTPIPLAATVRESGAGSFPYRQLAVSPRSSFLCPFLTFTRSRNPLPRRKSTRTPLRYFASGTAWH